MAITALLEQVSSLGHAEQVQLFDFLSQQIAPEPASTEIIELLDERLADLENNPDTWRPAADVLRDLRSKWA